MSDQSARKRQYERALRWYPEAWRQEHGPALVGDLMDQDDARGRRRLAAADRLSLIAHGVRVRSLQRAVPSSAALTLRLIGLAGAASVAIWYWTTSPTDYFGVLPIGSSVLVSRVPRSFLDNGTVVPAMLLALALAASLARRDSLARVIAGAAAVAALVVTQLAIGTWGGPDAPIGAILVISGVMGAVSIYRWTAVLGFITLIAGTFLLELCFAGAPRIFVVVAGACFVVAAVTGVLTLLRWRGHHRSTDTEAGLTT